MNQSDQIYVFMKNKPLASLKEIYRALPDVPEPSIRRAIRTDKKNRFTSVAKGVYRLQQDGVEGLLVEGNGRKLSTIHDSSIDLIITDHGWDDKKANTGGNRNLSDYPTFNYTKEDFEEKARVLKDGSYLVEILPYELPSNSEYLAEIKKLAKEAGFLYYAKIMWKKKSSNTGRVKKGIEDIYIFSKGKARVLNNGCKNGKPLAYSTAHMLEQIIDIPISKNINQKNHQAEKPIELFEYLIEELSLEKDIVLDTNGGSCNLLAAALNKDRFAIVYEIMHDTVMRAVKRFGMARLY